MTRTHRSQAGDAATEVILATFRANGLFLAAGDELTADAGMTAARWQVLGAVALADRPLTVPQIARRKGLTRQSIHATVNRLVSEGLLELASNEDHRRSQLVRLTPRGRSRYSTIDGRQARWVNGLARGIDTADLQTTAQILEELSRRLEADRGGVST